MNKKGPVRLAIEERLRNGPADYRELVCIGAALVPMGVAARRGERSREAVRRRVSATHYSEAYRRAHEQLDAVVVGSRITARDAIANALKDGGIVRLNDGLYRLPDAQTLAGR